LEIKSSWDDGAKEDIKLAELLKKYNIKSTFFWTVAMKHSLHMGKVKEFLDEKDLETIAKDFEIGSHGWNHSRLTEVADHDLKREIVHSRQYWQDKVKQPINEFCYSRGRANDKIKKMVKDAGYTSARSTVVGNVKQSLDPFWIETAVHVGIDRPQYDGIPWREFGIKMFKQAKETDGVFHFFGHSWEIEQNNQWKALEGFLKDIS